MKTADWNPTIGAATDRPGGARSRFGPRWPGQHLRHATDQLLVWLERSRQRRQLSRLDAHLRRDLGLTQAAIDAEVAKPFWVP